MVSTCIPGMDAIFTGAGVEADVGAASPPARTKSASTIERWVRGMFSPFEWSDYIAARRTGLLSGGGVNLLRRAQTGLDCSLNPGVAQLMQHDADAVIHISSTPSPPSAAPSPASAW